MMNETQTRLILSTAPNLAEARRIAAALVDRQLAACVNLIPGLESHYRWQGKVETAEEILLLIKTTEAQEKTLLAALNELHPYEVPEGLVLPIAGGLASYLEWVAANSKGDS
ncbi:MAG: divalent-cation tolerance protein CutA [Bryobacter sp.]